MNQPLVSIIVPTYNSANYLGNCLQSIRDQSYQHIELIVVDNNSKDDTKAIAQKYTPYVYNQGPERSSQRNYGVKQSQGDYVLIIDSDMELSSKVVEACVNTIIENNNIKAIIIPEESFGEGFWTECKKLERSFYPGVDWQEAARFFEKKIYDRVGGYDEQLTGPEDYDLANRVEYEYSKESITRIKEIIYHNEQKLTLPRLLKKKFYYAATLDRYMNKPANQNRLTQQTSIVRRYSIFFNQPTKLFTNPQLGIGMLLMKTAEFSAGLAGYAWSVTRRVR